MLQKMKSFATENATSIFASIMKTIALLLVIATVITVILSAAHTVRVSDGTKTYVMTTVFDSADSITNRIANGNEYEVKNVSKGLYSTDVLISYYFPLTVTFGGKTETYTVTSGKLGDILNELNIKIDQFDIVSKPLDTELTNAAYIDIADVEFKTETYSESIPYGNTIEYSDKYYSTTQRVQNGHEGSKLVTCSVMYVNGVATTSTVIDEKVISEAVDSKTVIGTKAPKYASGVKTISTLEVPDDLMLDENGIPVNYKKSTTLRATAYSHTGSRCATGVWPEPGYVAVDPNEIPYGTRMYIVSSDGRFNYGYAIAADTGGFIYGNRTDMDLFMDTEGQCVNFGRRNITVYFLD